MRSFWISREANQLGGEFAEKMCQIGPNIEKLPYGAT